MRPSFTGLLRIRVQIRTVIASLNHAQAKTIDVHENARLIRAKAEVGKRLELLEWAIQRIKRLHEARRRYETRIALLDQKSERLVGLKSAIRRVTSRPPLSKFGLNAHVSVAPLKALRDLIQRLRISDHTQLAIYKNGRTYKFDNTTTLRRWLDDLASLSNDSSLRFPPIAATTQVAQKIRHTWFPKNSLNGSLS